jgi:hypothetical protein
VNRDFYLSIAASGLRMPIGADLALHEETDPEAIVLDGPRLGRVVERAARTWGSPLALPLMDLRLEKADLLSLLGVNAPDLDAAHLHAAPGPEAVAQVLAAADAPWLPRHLAHFGALRYIAGQTDLLPVGMAIGPFSLMTKLMSDPITAVAMAARGVAAEEDDQVHLAETSLRLAEFAVARSLRGQAAAGAKAVMICEPAASRVYISPKMMERGSDVFERYVMQPNLRLKQQLDDAGVDLIFHDCGELIDSMVEQFATRLHPVILSLGNSRRLWEDARLVPRDVVLFGNLPTKNFYSDDVVPPSQVRALADHLASAMAETGHPYILGSECDVLYVPEYAATIRKKLDLAMSRH